MKPNLKYLRTFESNVGLVTIWEITFHPLFIHNNKYFSLKLWETFKDTDGRQLTFLFFENKKET